MRSFLPLSVLGLSSAALLFTLPAHAGPTYESASEGTFTFYGQFSPSWTHFNDGAESQGELADNAKSSSRVGFTIFQPIGDYELNFKFETAIGFRASDSISQFGEDRGLHWDRENLRHVDFSLKTPNYGTFYLGQGSMATDGIGEESQSPTTVVNDVAIGDAAGSYFLRQTDGTLSGISVGDAFGSFDGSRRGRIRYDSPSYMGVSLRTAYGRNILNSDDGDDYWDLALAYENELASGITITGGVGHSVRDREDGGDDVKDTFASASVLLPSGFNAALTVGERNDAGSYYYGQVGYVGNWVDWGKTSLAVDYYNGQDMVSDGDSAKSWGVAMVQNVASLKTDIYAGYRSYDYDDNATSYQKATSYMVGARWKF
ncbi:porin [Paracoccus sp. S1E-3]|uniref:porin n=1 Tax=Paracoccus sp. S1E-3 TaxID=2756130 RepID=UPI0015EEA030|nr:porin [Paracoccus sp. S1E-3]MBA4491489.1 porin [Paracoccus sp. S1E-3]